MGQIKSQIYKHFLIILFHENLVAYYLVARDQYLVSKVGVDNRHLGSKPTDCQLPWATK